MSLKYRILLKLTRLTLLFTLKSTTEEDKKISRMCIQYIAFLDSSKLMKQNIFKQDRVALMLKLLLQTLYGCHNQLVEHYEISIFSLLRRFFSLLYHQFLPGLTRRSLVTFLVPLMVSATFPHRNDVKLVFIPNCL